MRTHFVALFVNGYSLPTVTTGVVCDFVAESSIKLSLASRSFNRRKTVKILKLCFLKCWGKTYSLLTVFSQTMSKKTIFKLKWSAQTDKSAQLQINNLAVSKQKEDCNKQQN